MIGSTCRGQQSGYTQPSYEQPAFPAPAPLSENGIPASLPVTVAQDSGGLSDWIVYHRDCCEGKQGRITPFYTELYVEAGPTFPVGGMTMSRQMENGWSFAGGARALFFNEQMTSAWVVDAHVINTNEYAGKLNTAFPVTVFQGGAKLAFTGGGAVVEDWNRVAFGLGFGRDWFPWRPANADGCSWRLGVDGGGRWGSDRVDFDQFGHLSSVCETIYAGAHSDVEFPCGPLIWHVGVRCEWNYTWSTVLQRSSDIQEISLFFTLGARY